MGCTGNPQEEEKECRPSPCFLDEVDIEDVVFAGEIMRVAEGVGEAAEEGVGGVEVGIVSD